MVNTAPQQQTGSSNASSELGRQLRMASVRVRELETKVDDLTQQVADLTQELTERQAQPEQQTQPVGGGEVTEHGNAWRFGAPQ